MRLVLVRHGQTEWNAVGRFQGQADTNLSPLGREQAAAVAQAVRRFNPVALYSSTLVRAFHTAERIGAVLGLDILPEPDLRETNLGHLEGLSAEETRKRFPDFFRQWEEDPGAAVTPGGESVAQVQARAWRVVERLRERHGDATVVAVTHNFVVRALLCRVADVPLRNFRRFRVDVGSITVFDLAAATGQVVTVNEAVHLATLAAQATPITQLPDPPGRV